MATTRMKRFTSWMLTVAMLLAMLPASITTAFAAGGGEFVTITAKDNTVTATAGNAHDGSAITLIAHQANLVFDSMGYPGISVATTEDDNTIALTTENFVFASKEIVTGSTVTLNFPVGATSAGKWKLVAYSAGGTTTLDTVEVEIDASGNVVLPLAFAYITDIPAMTVGTPITAITDVAAGASGGTAPYTFSATGLPTGLSMAANGTISGTPTTAAAAIANTGITITVTDSAKASVTATIGAGAVKKCPATMKAEAILLNPIVGVPYTLTGDNVTVEDSQTPADNIKNHYDIAYSGAGISGTTFTATNTTPVQVTVTATPKSADAANYATPDVKSFSITAKNPTTSTFDAVASVNAAEYGDTFTVTATPHAGSDGAVTFDTATNCVLVGSVSGNVGTYRVTASTGSATVVVNQAVSKDGSIAAGTVTATVTTLSPRVIDVTGSLTATGRVYDGTTAVAVPENASTLAVSNMAEGDTNITLSGTFTGTASKDVGTDNAVTLTPTVTIVGTNANKYTITGTVWPTVKVAITARPVTLDCAAGKTTTYGTAIALSNTDFTAQTADANTGLVGTDDVAALGLTYACAATTTTTGVGSYPVTVGAKTNNNYSVTITVTNKVAVTPKALTYTTQNITKVFDNTTALTTANKATLQGGLVGVINSDDVSINLTGVVYSKAGVHASANLTGGTPALTGAKAGNYSWTYADTNFTGAITPKAQTLTRTDSVGDTLYVGGPNVTLTASTTATGDTNAKTPTFTCTDTSVLTITSEGVVSIVGAGTANIKVNCEASDNYAAATELAVTITVNDATANTLSIKGGNAVTKQYGDKHQIVLENDNNKKTVSYASSDESKLTVSTTGEVIVKSYTGTATITITQPVNADATPIAGKTLTLTVTMTPKTLTFNTTALTATNRAYNGLNTVILGGTLSLGSIVTGDDASAIGITTSAGASLVGTMSDANANTAKTVTVSGYGALTGTKAAYYALPAAAPTVTVDIAKANIGTWTNTNMGAITATKVYDGTATDAAVTFAGAKTITGQNNETFILTPKVTQKVTYAGAGPFKAADNSYSFDIAWSNFTLTGTANISNYNVPAALTYATSGTVTKANQEATAVTVDNSGALHYGDALTSVTTALDHAALDGATVTYSVVAGTTDTEVTDVVTIDANGKITAILKPGTFRIMAEIAASTNYNGKTVHSTAITVGKKELSLNKTTLSGKLSDGATGYDLSNSTVAAGYVTAVVPAGLKSLTDANATISYGAVTNGSATGAIATTQLTWGTTTAGTFTFPVTMATNEYYTLASASNANVVTVTISEKDSQTITFTTPAPTTITYGDADFTVVAAGGAGSGAITYVSSDDTVATVGVTTGVVHIVKAGTVTITATKAEDATHAQATATATLKIGQKALTYTGAITKVYDGANTFTASAVTGGAFGNKVATDEVTIGTIVGTFANVNVHTAGKLTVTAAGTLTGAAAGNYTLAIDGVTITTAVTKAKLQATTLTATKDYDGDDVIEVAELASTDINGIGGEKLTITGFVGAKYKDKDYHVSTVAANKGTAITAAAKAGSNPNNYDLSDLANLTINGVINKKALTVAKKAPISMAPGGLKVSDLVTVTGIQTGDTIDSLFGTTFTNNTANAKGVTVHVQTTATPPVTATLPLTAGSYTFGFAVTKATFETANTNYTITDPAITDGTITVTTPPPAGGGYVTETYMVTFDAGKFGKLDGNSIVSVEKGKFVKSTPKVIANANYNFKGWSLDGKTVVDPLTVAITKGTSFTAIYTTYPVLDKENHMQYIKGYDDGTFKPSNRITRAEAATMFARVMKDKIDMNATYATAFTDVPADAWYAKYVGFMEKYGVIKGYADGTFKPNAPITRAEFATMVSRFGELTKMDKNIFSDVADNFWAKNEILSAAANNWVGGYEDGTFKPDSDITRAEAVKIINSMLGRVINAQSVEGATYTTFTDMTVEHWAYYHVIEAANGHEYNKVDGNGVWKK